MNTTDNYSLKIYEGSDNFNPLTVENANFEAIDEAMFANQQASITEATETKTGTVHALVRDVDTAMFRFVATSDYASGDTFTVDGTAVTAKNMDGSALSAGAFVINSNVLCCLVGSLLTVYGASASASAQDAERLGGQLPSYYAKASDLTAVQSTANAAQSVANSLSTKLSQLPSGTLQAGQTSLTITNVGIREDGLIDIYTDKYGLYPTDVVTVNGSITMTFEAQTDAVIVKVRCL